MVPKMTSIMAMFAMASAAPADLAHSTCTSGECNVFPADSLLQASLPVHRPNSADMLQMCPGPCGCDEYQSNAITFDCPAKTGSAVVELKRQASQIIAPLPSNANGLTIEMEAGGDLDLQLYDDGVEQCVFGYACNHSKAGEIVQYKDMSITFSGDDTGDNTGRPVKESIIIVGKTTKMRLDVKSYADTSGTITYSHGEISPCVAQKPTCSKCTDDSCGAGETAKCDGSRSVKCVARPPAMCRMRMAGYDQSTHSVLDTGRNGEYDSCHGSVTVDGDCTRVVIYDNLNYPPQNFEAGEVHGSRVIPLPDYTRAKCAGFYIEAGYPSAGNPQSRPPAMCTMHMAGFVKNTYSVLDTGRNGEYDNCGRSVTVVGDCTRVVIYDNDNSPDNWEAGAVHGKRVIDLPDELPRCAGFYIEAGYS